MTLEEMIRLGALFRRLASDRGGDFSETGMICRVHQVSRLSKNDMMQISQLASEIARSNLGSLEVFGEIIGEVALNEQSVSALDGEPFTVRFKKKSQEGTAFFVTLDGFEAALKDRQFMLEARQIWIAANFVPFATQTCCYSPWGNALDTARPRVPFDSPRRLVRDQTHNWAPEDIAPWYLTNSGEEASTIFDAWKEQAARHLAFSLPTEVSTYDDGVQVVLKGARSVFATVDLSKPLSSMFETLTEAVRWVYDQRRDTETKFHLLNNHLALYWPDGAKWPMGLSMVLNQALASAREAFAFHLQEDSKEAMKTLGDLRKTLQDEVSRSQMATRDLLSALWRDAAIAGAVFALRTATANISIVKWIATSAALLLFGSLLTTILSNWRFDALAKTGREQWRVRLYAFMPVAQWEELVQQPIGKARRVYRLSIIPVLIAYSALILALLWVSFPTQVEALVGDTWELADGLFQFVKEMMQRVPPSTSVTD